MRLWSPSVSLIRVQGRFTDHSRFPDHAEKMHELPDESLRDILPIAKRIAIAQEISDYNILQNNGRIAHQVFTLLWIYSGSPFAKIYSYLKEVPHVHFHVIPKPAASLDEGLSIGWPAKPMAKEELQKVLEDLKAKLGEGGSVL